MVFHFRKLKHSLIANPKSKPRKKISDQTLIQNIEQLKFIMKINREFITSDFIIIPFISPPVIY